MNLKSWDVVRRAVLHYGDAHQVDKAIEEMAELTKELLKNRQGLGNGLAVAEEMADVKIMLAQLEIIYDNRGLVKSFVDAKLKRLDRNMQESSQGTIAVCEDGGGAE